MTSKQPTEERWPLPLAAKPGDLADGVRAYAHSTGETNGEAANYARVVARMERPSRRVPRIVLGISAGVLAAAVGVILVLGHPADAPFVAKAQRPFAPPVNQHPVPSAVATSTAIQPSRKDLAPAVPSLSLSGQSVSLPTGESEIVGQAKAILSVDAVASAALRREAADILLQRGTIELHVTPQAPGHHLSVTVGRYRFTVVGTVFTLSRSQARLELQVREGAVAVARGTRRLAIVRAGGSWNAVDEQTTPVSAPPLPKSRSAEAPLGPPAPVFPAPSPVPSVGEQPTPAQTPSANKSPDQDCRQLAANHRTQDAMACYEQQAMRNGLAGETAAYQLARLWRDALGQPERALAAFESQRSRFPSGVLRREAELSIIELLPRLGRHAEALADSQHFLTAYPDDERKGELHLLRGNIYREAIHDLDHAQREYALGANAKGRVGDDSRFFHAVCLEALRRTGEARRAYQSYLGQHGAVHAAEAERRLAGLAP
jgi:hypothetical protein